MERPGLGCWCREICSLAHLYFWVPQRLFRSGLLPWGRSNMRRKRRAGWHVGVHVQSYINHCGNTKRCESSQVRSGHGEETQSTSDAAWDTAWHGIRWTGIRASSAEFVACSSGRLRCQFVTSCGDQTTRKASWHTSSELSDGCGLTNPGCLVANAGFKLHLLGICSGSLIKERARVGHVEQIYK